MSEQDAAFLDKAQESLAGAESEYLNGRYNNCANRAHYACFQAAVHALREIGERPPGTTDQWGHGFVQARFAGDLLNRRKRFQPELRTTLEQNYQLRVMADYQGILVPELRAVRAMRRAAVFVAAITAGGQAE